jgi:hypothetical protein
MHILTGLAQETWTLLLEMAPWLMFGFFVAGILHVVFPAEKIERLFAGNSMKAVVRASIFGVPLPLCSCGVIPVAAHLRKEGAGKGPTLAFLISTPTTGIDSIMATYALLGPFFAVVRPAAAFFAGCLAGALVLLTGRNGGQENLQEQACETCGEKPRVPDGFLKKTAEVFRYAFLDLLQDVGQWLVIGIVAGAMISYFIPEEMIGKHLGNPLLAYPLMLLIAVPLYVCATGSIPIAASLIMKGMSPGAGLVFLIAGPATNTATISFVSGKMGRKTLVIYLVSIVGTAVLFGLGLDALYMAMDIKAEHLHHAGRFMPQWLNASCAAALIGLLLLGKILEWKRATRGAAAEGMVFSVPDANCEHCRGKITGALKSAGGVTSVIVDLKKRTVSVAGSIPAGKVVSSLAAAGYEAKEIQNY